MKTGFAVGILVALLLLLGGLLFIAAQFIINKMQSANIPFGKRKGKLWVWRSFIVVLLLYSLFLLIANKEPLFAFFAGPFEIFLVIILVVYFVALIELVVIDILLPDVTEMWKRIVIEVVVFALLCGLTIFTFNLSLTFVASLA